MITYEIVSRVKIIDEKRRVTRSHVMKAYAYKQGATSLLHPANGTVDNINNGAGTSVESAQYEQEKTGFGSHQSHPNHSRIDDINLLDILDWQDALTRSANKPDLAAKLIIMMLDTINDEKQALTQAWDARDRHMLAQIAHRILGGSRYTGVPQLRQASQDLEDKCLLNLQHITPAQFAMLEPYYVALITALNNLQTLDLSAYPQLNYHRLSENDMTWKMI